MEEIKSLIELVAKLPTMAIWVIALFWAYKVVVVGSIFGVIRFGIAKLHDYLVQRKTIPPEIKRVEVQALIGGICIGSEVEPLMAQIHRVVGKGIGIQTQFVHRQSVSWLREAIDDKVAKDTAAGK
jgi:hypothetical protein